MTYEFENGEVASVDINGLVESLTDFFSDVRCYVDLVKTVPGIDEDSIFELIRDDLDIEIEAQVLDFTTEENTGRVYDKYFFSDDDLRTLVTEVVYEMGGDYQLIVERTTRKVMSVIRRKSKSAFQII